MLGNGGGGFVLQEWGGSCSVCVGGVVLRCRPLKERVLEGLAKGAFKDSEGPKGWCYALRTAHGLVQARSRGGFDCKFALEL